MKDVLGFIGVAAVIFFIAYVTMPDLTNYPRDTCDGPEGPRCGLAIRTDKMTGCQYLETTLGGITPRVDQHGKHICK